MSEKDEIQAMRERLDRVESKMDSIMQLLQNLTTKVNQAQPMPARFLNDGVSPSRESVSSSCLIDGVSPSGERGISASNLVTPSVPVAEVVVPVAILDAMLAPSPPELQPLAQNLHSQPTSSSKLVDGDLPSAELSLEWYHQRFKQYFEQYEPHRLHKLSALIEHYKGQEALLLRMLEQRELQAQSQKSGLMQHPRPPGPGT